MLLTVVVPDGLLPGDSFVVTAEDGREFSVVVPDGVMGNVAIEVEVDNDPAPPMNTTIEVNIPGGLFVGDEFIVEYGGQEFNVAVPDGCGPGDVIQVDVPPAELPPPEAAPRELPPLPHPSEKVFAGEHWLGRRVMVDWDGAECRNDVLGAVRDFDEATGWYVVELDSGLIQYELTGEQVRTRGPFPRFRRPRRN